MSPEDRTAELEAEVDYYRDRVALLRAKLYRQGIGTSARLQDLERSLEGAQGRLHRARASTPEPPQADAARAR
ncbi:MAG: hypothetical protein ACLP8S_14185 [Solirubrobacteraceae bacterium]